MKHEDPSEARSALAQRITQRALHATKHLQVEIVPLGEPDPNRQAYSQRIRDEINRKRRTAP